MKKHHLLTILETNNLGKNQTSFIKINEKKFKEGFLKFMIDKSVTQKNVILAIHYAYQFAIKDKSKRPPEAPSDTINDK